MSKLSLLRPAQLRRPLLGPLAATALVMIPVVVALVALLSRETWYPTGDMAQAELHMRSLWSHPPLVGAAGRIASDAGVQGSHPGPSLWVALFPVYALLGRSSAALMISAVVVHGTFIFVALWMARRFAGVSLMLPLALGYAALVRSSGPGFFTEPWNPWFAVFPFAIFLLAIWAALERTPRWGALAIVAGSHCIQCHVGYLVIIAGLCAVAAAVLLWRAVRAHAVRTLVSPFAASAGLLGLVWLPPLIDQATRTPGNALILLQHFASPTETFLGTSMAIRIFLSELNVLGPWLTGPALIERNTLVGIPTIIAWAATAWFAWRARRWNLIRLHAVLAAAVALGGASLLRIFGSYQEYTIRWFWVLTVLILAACAAAAWQLASPARRQLLSTPLFATWGALALAMCLLGTVQFAQRASVTGEQDSAVVAALTPRVQAALSSEQRYLIRWHDPVGLGATPFGLLLELERRGYAIGVDQQFAAAALPHRVFAEPTTQAVLWVVLGARIEQFRSNPAFREVADADLRSDQQQARSGELSALLQRRFAEIGQPELFDRLDAQYGAAGLLFIQPPLPTDIAAAVSEFVALRVPAAVFLAPPGTPEPSAPNG